MHCYDSSCALRIARRSWKTSFLSFFFFERSSLHSHGHPTLIHVRLPTHFVCFDTLRRAGLFHRAPAVYVANRSAFMRYPASGGPLHLLLPVRSCRTTTHAQDELWMLGCATSHPPHAISTTLSSGVHMARINLPACWILEDTQCK